MGSLAAFIDGIDLAQLLFLLFSAVAALLCITFHELAHGYVAYRLGDPTAKRMGRLTLNPIKHLDFLGLLMMITVHVGWAKPVPVDMRYFKHPKRGMAITSMAGPAANFLMSMIALALGSALYHFGPAHTAVNYAILFLCYIAVLSVGLGLFNLLPISPLDGSKVLYALLPDAVYYKLLRYEKYGMIVIVALTWLGVFSRPLSFLISNICSFFCTVTFFPIDLLQYYFF